VKLIYSNQSQLYEWLRNYPNSVTHSFHYILVPIAMAEAVIAAYK